MVKTVFCGAALLAPPRACGQDAGMIGFVTKSCNRCDGGGDGVTYGQIQLIVVT